MLLVEGEWDDENDCLLYLSYRSSSSSPSSLLSVCCCYMMGLMDGSVSGNRWGQVALPPLCAAAEGEVETPSPTEASATTTTTEPAAGKRHGLYY